MKKIVFAIGMILVFGAVNAQHKISWTYSAKKLGNFKYEIRITATPPVGWHIYSQFTPEGGPVPTNFKFNNNVLVTFRGNVSEKGKVITYFDKNFKVNVKYFEGKADFIQLVTVKGEIKTNITGEVESMICNDRICMPPNIEKFNIALF